jgi:hypothetical protein
MAATEELQEQLLVREE